MPRPVLPVVAALATALLACPVHAPLHPMAVQYNNQCAQFINAGQLNDAETACNHALEFNPDYAEAWSNKGVIEMSRGKDDMAKDDFIKALRSNNDLAQAYNSLGVVELRQRHPGVARERFESALKVNPDYLEARYNLALAWLESGRRDEARREYRTLLLVNPRLADPHQDLGVMALEDHQVAEAITEMEAAVQLDPAHPTALLNLGAAYVEAGRYQDAQNAFHGCLNADPQNLPCRRAIQLVTRAAAAQAPVLRELVEAEGDYARGLRQLEKGAREGAERSFRACAGGDPACRYALHQMLEEEGKTSEAAAICADFLRVAPADLYPAETAHCEQEVSRPGSMAPPRQGR